MGTGGVSSCGCPRGVPGRASTCGMPRTDAAPDRIVDSGPFTARRRARREGSAKGGCAARDLDRPFHGVRMPRIGDSRVEMRCRAYARADASAARSSAIAPRRRSTASRCRGRRDRRLDVAASSRTACRGRGRAGPPARHAARSAVDHRTRAARGLGRSTPGCQLAAELGLRELVMIGDALVRRRRPLAAMGDARGRGARHRGRRGHRALVAALGAGARPAPTRRRRRSCGWISSRSACPNRSSTSTSSTHPAVGSPSAIWPIPTTG